MAWLGLWLELGSEYSQFGALHKINTSAIAGESS